MTKGGIRKGNPIPIPSTLIKMQMTSLKMVKESLNTLIYHTYSHWTSWVTPFWKIMNKPRKI